MGSSSSGDSLPVCVCRRRRRRSLDAAHTHAPLHTQQPTTNKQKQTTKAYLLIPITGVVLGSSNLIGYYKCSKDAKKQLQAMGANFAGWAAANAMQSRFQAAIARV